MSLRNTSQERRLFCSLHPHPKLCKFFAISFDGAKAFDRKKHGSILQFAAEGDAAKTNPRPRLSHCGASESQKKSPPAPRGGALDGKGEVAMRAFPPSESLKRPVVYGNYSSEAARLPFG